MKQLPKGCTFDGEPVCYDTEDCMGRPQKYWSRTVRMPDKSMTIGYGQCPDEATCNVIKQAITKAEFAALPDTERLHQILAAAKERGRFYDMELVEVISILVHGKNQ